MDNKKLKEEFEKFAKTFPQKIGGTAINAFADWWIQQMDLQRKELAKSLIADIPDDTEIDKATGIPFTNITLMQLKKNLKSKHLK